MTTRRQFLSHSALAMLGAAGTAFALPSETRENAIPDGSASKDMITDEADKAIARGLAFLAASQARLGDGSFGVQPYEGNVAITSLAALAFMAAGNQPARGLYGSNVSRALEAVLACGERDNNRPPGYLNNVRGTPHGQHGPMYGHGFGTLFLAEATGMVQDNALRNRLTAMLQKAVKLIIDSQDRNPEGAWRYNPDSLDADLSVTICQIMALRSARNAGLFVPKSNVDRCVQYVRLCQDRRHGSFRYQKQGGATGFGNDNPAFARTAAGVCALYSAGIYEGEEITAGLNYLMQYLKINRNMGQGFHYFYGHYYAVQAMWTAGGSYWSEWFPAIRNELLSRQQPNGAWADQICEHYGTAMACIILQIPNNYLPIMQK
jgi:hypothetical protein